MILKLQLQPQLLLTIIYIMPRTVMNKIDVPEMDLFFSAPNSHKIFKFAIGISKLCP